MNETLAERRRRVGWAVGMTFLGGGIGTVYSLVAMELVVRRAVTIPQIGPPPAFISQSLGFIFSVLAFSSTVGAFYAFPTTLLVLPLLRQRLRQSTILTFVVILVSAVVTGVVWVVFTFLVYEHSLREPLQFHLMGLSLVVSLIVTPIYFYLTRIRHDALDDQCSEPARQP